MITIRRGDFFDDDFASAIRKVKDSSLKGLSDDDKIEIVYIVEDILKEFEISNEIKNKLIKEHGKEENGQIKVSPGDESFYKYVEAFNKLAEKEVNIDTVYEPAMIPDDLKKGSSPGEILTLRNLFILPERKKPKKDKG